MTCRKCNARLDPVLRACDICLKAGGWWVPNQVERDSLTVHQWMMKAGKVCMALYVVCYAINWYCLWPR